MQTILRFLRAVQYRKGVIIVALVASCLLGGLYYTTTSRVYESRAELLIQQMGEMGVNLSESAGRNRTKDSMVTYKNTLCSEVVIEDALAKLPPEYRACLADAPRDRWAEALQANLNVTIVRNSTILKIAYQSERPYEAEAVVQSIIQAYLDFMNKLHQNAAGEVYDIFHREKISLEKQIQAKQYELVAARRNAEELEIRDGEKGTSVVIKSAITRNEAWNEAHKERLDAQARLVAIEAAVRGGEDLVEFALTTADKMGGERFLQRLGLNLPDPNAASHIRRQLTEDQAKLQSALQVYGNAHHKVREIQERIQASGYLLQNQHRMNRAQLHQISNDELAGLLLDTARQQFKQAAARENLALSSYEEAKHAAVALDGARAQLDMLKLDWDHLQRTYEIVLERLKDINLDQKNGTLRIKVLSKPKVPAAPVWPRITMVAFLSIIAGLGGGVAVVYLQDILDDRFRSPEEMQTQLGLPVLAMIGKLEPLADHGMDAVHVHVHPNAAEVEAFRTLRTALALTDNGMQRLVVSSSEPGDGKTTVVVNLATAYAQSGKRTLLIDADMRRPGLTPLLALKGQRGLSTALRAEVSVEEAAEANVYQAMVENLDVIPSGPRPVNPTELLVGDRFSELLSWAETRYDQILIDSPPALVSDTAIIGRLVDGVLLTVLPEKNRRRVVIRSAESFPSLGIKVLGIVVNRISGENGKDYYGYGYGYSQGYGGYGHDENDSQSGDDIDESPPQTPVKIVRRVA